MVNNPSQSDKECLLPKDGNDDAHIKPMYSKENAENGGSESRIDLSGNNQVNDNNKGDKLSMFRQSKRRLVTLLLLCVACFCGGGSHSMLAPFFPALAVTKGMSESVTGFLFSISELINFAGSLCFSSVMFRIGPKFLYVSGMFVSGVGSILFGLAVNSPPGAMFISLCFICRSIEALTVSAFYSCSFVIMTSEFPSHVTTVFGITETLMGFGLMAGPSLGGVLNQFGGPSMPFYVIGVIMLLIALLVFIFLQPPKETTAKKKSHFFTILSSSLVWVGTCTSLAVGVGNSFLWPVFSVYLQQFGLSTSLIGLIFVIIPGLYGLTTAVWGYLLDKKDVKEVMSVCGSLASAVGYLLIGPTPLLLFLPVKLWVVILGLVIYGVHFSAVLIAAVRCLIVGTVELGFDHNLEAYAVVSGLFNAAFALGTFIGPVVSGALVEAVGFRWASTYMSGVNLLTALCSSCYFSVRLLRKGRMKAGTNSQEDCQTNRDDHAHIENMQQRIESPAKH